MTVVMLRSFRDKDTDRIRINCRWRICFRWTGTGPENVEIVDYH